MKDSRISSPLYERRAVFFPVLALCLLAGSACTNYRTYNSLHWAREAYKQGKREQQDEERRQRQTTVSTAKRPTGVQVTGAKNFEEAARKCLSFLSQSPEGRRTDDALMLMGEAFFEVKRFVQAENSLQKLLDTQKKSKFRDDAQYYLVLVMLAREDVSLAELDIEHLLDEYPKSKYRPLAQFHLRKKYFDLENYERAQEVFSGVLDNYPNFKQKGDVISHLARINFELREYDKALTFYERLRKAGRNGDQRREGLIGQARCTSRLGRHEEALTLYQEALRTAKFVDQRAEAQLGIDVEYTFLDHPAQAMGGFREVILKNPRTEFSAAAWYELGLLYKNYLDTPALAADSIQVDSTSLLVFAFNSKALEPLKLLSQKLLSMRLAELALRAVRREDPYSPLAVPSDHQVAEVVELFGIHEQIEASDSTTNRDALARLQFLLAEHEENIGQTQMALAGYERLIFEFPLTIWTPRSALNIFQLSTELGDSVRARQALELVLENFPDTRYADQARLSLGLPIPERPPGFYLDELSSYVPPKIVRAAPAALAGAAAGARLPPGKETFLQMRRRLWWSRFGKGGGA